MKGYIDPLDDSLSDFADMKVVLSEDRMTATISGVPRVAFLNLLTRAFLFRYDNPFKPVYVDPDSDMADIKTRNAKDSQRYDWQQCDLICALEAGLKSDGDTRGLVSDRKMRKQYPENYPATTDVKPAVDPKAVARAEKIAQISAAITTLGDILRKIKGEE
jgi:hypothetical protein